MRLSIAIIATAVVIGSGVAFAGGMPTANGQQTTHANNIQLQDQALDNTSKAIGEARQFMDFFKKESGGGHNVSKEAADGNAGEAGAGVRHLVQQAVLPTEWSSDSSKSSKSNSSAFIRMGTQNVNVGGNVEGTLGGPGNQTGGITTVVPVNLQKVGGDNGVIAEDARGVIPVGKGAEVSAPVASNGSAAEATATDGGTATAVAKATSKVAAKPSRGGWSNTGNGCTKNVDLFMTRGDIAKVQHMLRVDIDGQCGPRTIRAARDRVASWDADAMMTGGSVKMGPDDPVFTLFCMTIGAGKTGCLKEASLSEDAMKDYGFDRFISLLRHQPTN